MAAGASVLFPILTLEAGSPSPADVALPAMLRVGSQPSAAGILGAALVLSALAACTSDGSESGTLPGFAPAAAEIPVVADSRLIPGVDIPAGQTTLRLGVTPYLDPDVLTKQFEPVKKHISAALGVDVELVVADTYQDQIEQAV